MKKAGGIVAIIAGIFGILSAGVTLILGGVGSAVNANNANTVIGLGWGGVIFSFLTIILAAVALGVQSRIPGILLVFNSIAGAILGGTLVAIFMVLVFIGGILIIIGGGKNKTPIDNLPYSANPQKSHKIRNIIIFASVSLAAVCLFLAAIVAANPNKTNKTATLASQQTTPQQQVAASTQPQSTAPLLPDLTITTAPSRTPVPTATLKPAEAGASRSNPLLLETVFKGENWSIVISDVIRGQNAAQAIAKANQFNEPPKVGYEYLIADVKIMNISDKQEAQSANFVVDLRLTGDRNIVYDSASVVAPKEFEGELFPQGKADGQIVFEVPSGEKNLIFMVNEMMSFNSKAMRFMAVDNDAKVVPNLTLRDIKPTDLGKSRDNPAKIGDMLVSGAWEFKVMEAIRGDKAAEMAKKANQFNKPVPEGQEYIAIRLTARYLGTDGPDSSENINGSYLSITGEKNVVYKSPSVVPPEPALDATLFAGGETEGWEILSVSKDENGLIVIFKPLFSFSSDEIRYIAIE